MRYRFIDFPRSVLIIDWLVIVACLGGSRFVYRFFREFHGYSRSGGNRVIIIGADDTGEMLLREMRQNRKTDYAPVGFLDKKPGKTGRYIHGVPILGGIDKLDAVAAEKRVREVIVASPSITGGEMRKIVESCERAGVLCKTVPAIGDILNGKRSV